ncbi:MAG: DNA/RNA non-specific endonuclease [Acidobacteriia bacterium]|nr:DNA/RNA non-specific endonuclease [Terriglobia bacterium]
MVIPQAVIDKSEKRAGNVAALDSLKNSMRTKAPKDLEPKGNLRRRFQHHLSAGGPGRRTEIEFERIINGNELVSINYLEKGAQTAKSVGRVHVKDSGGELIGFGTGFMIAPGLMMTNHHVLENANQARRSQMEFDFELDAAGKDRPTSFFSLRPEQFFFSSEDLDFSVVAVSPKSEDQRRHVAEFSFLSLIEQTGKAVRAEYLTIIQHPGGQRKQVCVRENQLLKIEGNVILYATDTLGGSSGSPVFNNSWQVVALHHSGVPDKDKKGNILTVDGKIFDSSMDESRIKWIANEGIRVSRIVATLKAAHATNPLLKPIFDGATAPLPESSTAAAGAGGSSVQVVPQAAGSSVTLNIPLTVTLSIGGAVAAPRDPVTRQSVSSEEVISIDPDYENRLGYDANFLGKKKLTVPLPKLSKQMRKDAAAITEPAEGEDEHLLNYHHYSLVQNAKRKLAFYTAVNIDGETAKKPKRETDRWFFDPRISREDQAGEELYDSNSLDRGHLVRRLDPAWGTNAKQVKVANDDTFHFTNCSPQHKNFNQNKSTWAGLEDYILNNAANEKFRASIFSGPVLEESDELFRGIQLPKQFWKVAVMVGEDGKLMATGYLLSQAKLLQGIHIEEFEYGAYKTFQVPVSRIEKMTGLNFGTLHNTDPMGDASESTGFREIESLDQIRLGKGKRAGQRR